VMNIRHLLKSWFRILRRLRCRSSSVWCGNTFRQAVFVLLAMGKMWTTTLCEFFKKKRFDDLIFYEVGYFQASIFF
jgi:hypothetical protein